MIQPAILQRLSAAFHDPPPEFVFEIGPQSIAMARAVAGTRTVVEPLDSAVLLPSPVNDNILQPELFEQAVKKLVSTAGSPRKQRRAALVLPDHSARVSVLDFDHFPNNAEDQLPLLQFRLKKTLPYDVESAAISYFAQPMAITGKREVITVVTPLEVIARYEAPFRAANVHCGVVTISHLAMLDLVPVTGVVIVAKLSGQVITVMAVDHGALRLVRTLELSEITLDDVAADLYPTFAYCEDTLGSRPEGLVLSGFDQLASEAARRFADELSAKVAILPHTFVGLAGYLQSRRIQAVAA